MAYLLTHPVDVKYAQQQLILEPEVEIYHTYEQMLQIVGLLRPQYHILSNPEIVDLVIEYCNNG